MSELKPKQDISIEIVSGVEGLCLLVNDYRISGPKPWGGGTVTHTFTAKLTDIERAVYGNRRTQPENEPLTLEELRQMDGEPVYVVTLDNPLENQPYWAIAGINSNDSRYQNGVALYNRVQDDWGAFDLYGDTWLAYRTKPERSEG